MFRRVLSRSRADLSAREPSTGMPRSGPNSGARVDRTLTEDGSVVTTYSPRPRDGSGPVIVETPRIGQDPRLAGTPNEDLLEDTPYGRLPIIGADGLRPMEQYRSEEHTSELQSLKRIS